MDGEVDLEFLSSWQDIARSPSQLTQYATIANKGRLATIKYRYDYPHPQPQPHYQADRRAVFPTLSGE